MSIVVSGRQYNLNATAAKLGCKLAIGSDFILALYQFMAFISMAGLSCKLPFIVCVTRPS